MYPFLQLLATEYLLQRAPKLPSLGVVGPVTRSEKVEDCNCHCGYCRNVMKRIHLLAPDRHTRRTNFQNIFDLSSGGCTLGMIDGSMLLEYATGKYVMETIGHEQNTLLRSSTLSLRWEPDSTSADLYPGTRNARSKLLDVVLHVR